jgi:hypothetical protein
VLTRRFSNDPLESMSNMQMKASAGISVTSLSSCNAPSGALDGPAWTRCSYTGNRVQGFKEQEANKPTVELKALSPTKMILKTLSLMKSIAEDKKSSPRCILSRA